jgi:hypothetical protein
MRKPILWLGGFSPRRYWRYLAEGVEGDCLEAGWVGFGVGGDGFSGFESRRLKAFVISSSPRFKLMLLTDPRSMLLLISAITALPRFCSHPALQPAPAPLQVVWVYRHWDDTSQNALPRQATQSGF